MEDVLVSRSRAKGYIKIIKNHLNIIDELIHMIAQEQDNIPPEVQIEIADAVRHYRAMYEALIVADRRLRTV